MPPQKKKTQKVDKQNKPLHPNVFHHFPITKQNLRKKGRQGQTCQSIIGFEVFPVSSFSTATGGGTATWAFGNLTKPGFCVSIFSLPPSATAASFGPSSATEPSLGFRNGNWSLNLGKSEKTFLGSLGSASWPAISEFPGIFWQRKSGSEGGLFGFKAAENTERKICNTWERKKEGNKNKNKSELR